MLAHAGARRGAGAAADAAAVQPVAHSIVADLYAPEARGNAFGWIGFGTIFGGCIGTLLGVNVGDREEVMGIRGWRMVYIVMAVIGVLLAAVIFFLAVDPERGAMEPGYDPKKRLSEEARRERAKQWTLWHSMQELFAIKTFVMLFIRSAFDGIPTNANSLLILWFKYIGYTDSQVRARHACRWRRAHAAPATSPRGWLPPCTPAAPSPAWVAASSQTR